MILSIVSCKKKKTKIVDDPVIIACNYKTSGILQGKYCTTSTLISDTIQIDFFKDNCPDSTLNYKIINLYNSFHHWGVTIQDRLYNVNFNELNETGEISDTLKIKIVSGGIQISVKERNTYTPYLPFKKLN